MKDIFAPKTWGEKFFLIGMLGNFWAVGILGIGVEIFPNMPVEIGQILYDVHLSFAAMTAFAAFKMRFLERENWLRGRRRKE